MVALVSAAGASDVTEYHVVDVAVVSVDSYDV